MTKAEGSDLKKIINTEKKYKTYFSSKAGTLSVRVYTYTNSDYHPADEKNAINTLINSLGANCPSYTIIRRTYQGFIHDTDVLFS